MKATARALEPPPPGETGDELTDSKAVAAVQRALANLHLAKSADQRWTIRDVQFEKKGKTLSMTVKWDTKHGKNVVTLRMPSAFARVMRNRLISVLDR